MRGLLAVLLFAATAKATTVVVSVKPAVENDAPVRVSITATPITAGRAGAGRSFTVSGIGTSSFDLKAADGAVWDISLEAPGFWSAKQTVAISDKPLQLRFDVYRTARVRGTIIVPKDGPTVTTLGVGFRTAANAMTGEVECPVVANAWSCDIPALTSDLRLKSRGYMAHYRWDVKLPPGGDNNFGVLLFRRGASVVGRVEIDGHKEPMTAVVHLRAQQAAHAGFAKDTAVQALALKATVNAKGFFAFDGVAPGAYIISASQNGFVSEPRDIRVLADTEAELAKPLRLMKPEGVLVTISPPADVKALPWRLLLRPAEANVLPAEARVDAQGTHEFRGVPLGKYRLSVLSSDGTAWASQQLGIAANTAPVYIEMKTVHVKGQLLLGERPLAGGKLWFGGEHGAVAVPIESDFGGAFEGDLPHDGPWLVQVIADQPKVRRKLPKVEVRRSEKGVAQVTIKLPGTSLSGTAVSEQGGAISGAIVNAKSDDGVVQELTTPEGTFRFDGLPAGLIQLSASAAGSLLSSSVDVPLDESRPVDDVRLVLRDSAFLRGRVLSTAGAVPGAVVYGFSTADPNPTIVPSSSNEAGEFRVRLPPGTAEAALLVAAPGFSFRVLRVPVGQGPVAVSVEQNGGRLELDFAAGTWPLLRCDGIPIHFSILASWARANGGSVTATRLVAENVAAGEYVVCDGGNAASSKCNRGTLPPLGQLRLHTGE